MKIVASQETKEALIKSDVTTAQGQQLLQTICCISSFHGGQVQSKSIAVSDGFCE